MLVSNQGISWAHLALSLNVQKAKQIILGIQADTLSLFLVKTYIFLISRKRNEDTEASKFGKEITSRNHYSFVDTLVSGRSSMQEECPSVSARLARTCMTYWPLAASSLVQRHSPQTVEHGRVSPADPASEGPRRSSRPTRPSTRVNGPEWLVQALARALGHGPCKRG